MAREKHLKESEGSLVSSHSFGIGRKPWKKGEFFSIPLSPENSMNFRGTLVCRRKSLAIFDGRRGSFFFQKKDGFSPNSEGVGGNIGRGKSIEIGETAVPSDSRVFRGARSEIGAPGGIFLPTHS